LKLEEESDRLQQQDAGEGAAILEEAATRVKDPLKPLREVL
jgi:hypothetical protein